jgi:Zn2+/Cd2+-exporting ATPase
MTEPRTLPDRHPLLLAGIIGALLAAGGLLQWLPAEPSPWRWLPFAAAYLLGGGPIVHDTWAHLREGRLSIDFLMGAAALGALVVGEPFEGAVLIFLFTLSNGLEAMALGKTRRAVEALLDLRPDEATVLGPEGEEVGRVPVEALSPGDRIRVRPGERVAADGRVVDGTGEIDQSAITGESIPVRKEAGAEVFAGTILSGGALVVEVTRGAGETLLARIIQLVEEARANRAPAQHFIDRFAHPYTVGVVVVTALVALFPPLLFDVAWGDAFYRSMTLLVVASPCALIISTPAAILSGIANGARHGILFKGGAHLDQAGRIDTLAFDKTGTLTEGRPQLLDLVTRVELEGDPAGGRRDGAPFGEAGLRLLRIAASVERDSEHHLARATLEAAAARGLALEPALSFRAIPGEGVTGAVDGEDVWVGNEALAERMGLRPGVGIRGWMAEETSRGRSVVFVGTGKEVLGAMAFGDRLKPNAAATIRHLKYEGIAWITILSGDHPDAVRAVAAELGADEVRAGLLPHEKVEAVKVLVQRSRGVAMVGDGVNDAPAMAASHLGIAMGAAGTDVAIETADVVLMGDDVSRVDYLVHLGKRSRRVVRQNVWFSVGWMAMLVAVAGTVGIPLTLAVVAHEGSTLLVALNGLRLLAGRPHPPHTPGDGAPPDPPGPGGPADRDRAIPSAPLELPGQGRR